MMQTVATGRAGWTEDDYRDYVSPKTIATRKSLPGMRATIQLAQKVGAGLGSGVVLLRALPTTAQATA